MGRGEEPYPYVVALLSSSDRPVRERAWHALASARARVKSELDLVMDELIKLRHQMALNAGFENYRDYMFKMKNREYSLIDCFDFHAAVEKYVVPALSRVNELFRRELGVETYRPWDASPCMLKTAPFSNNDELMSGVHDMFQRMDNFFNERFQFMRNHGFLDLGSREGKAPNGFAVPFPISKHAFVFANFSPSFFAVIALIHEMGHAFNFDMQYAAGVTFGEDTLRMETAELFSYSMELLSLDKLDAFYRDKNDFRIAMREELRRALRMLAAPLASDVFQHWIYTNPNHSAEERDAKFLEINRRFVHCGVNISGLETEDSSNWLENILLFQDPFYSIEYSMAEVGAVQLLEIYRSDPQRALTLYKKGASADLNKPIAEIYNDTGIQFDLSVSMVKRVVEFLETAIVQLS